MATAPGVARVRRAVFLDRDGTLVREVHYLSRLKDLKVLPGVPEALARLGAAGYLRLLVTNQSGVARGYFDLSFVEACNAELRRCLRRDGADLEGAYVCPHHPDFGEPCGCRKPAPGLLTAAVAEHGLDRAACWVVGDKAADILLGRNGGCRTALVRTGYGAETERELERQGVSPDVVADDLAAAAEEILRH